MCRTVGSEEYAVSQIPSASKSQRNWSGSPSGSEDADALNSTGDPSGADAGASSAAFGGLFVSVVSSALP